MTEFKCKECDREFSGQQALEDHKRSKHFTAEKKPLSSKISKKYIFIFGVIAFILIIFLGNSLIAKIPSKYDEFTQCISDSGAKMYGAYWCPHCHEQKALFGRSDKFINYIECSLPNRQGQTQICIQEGIESYPTWDIDGERRNSLLTLEELSDLTGCELPE